MIDVLQSASGGHRSGPTREDLKEQVIFDPGLSKSAESPQEDVSGRAFSAKGTACKRWLVPSLMC